MYPLAIDFMSELQNNFSANKIDSENCKEWNEISVKNKEFYITNLPEGLPFFHQPFWLNLICEENWDVAIVIDRKKIVASMPYCFNYHKGNRNIIMPPLVRFLGPYIKPTDRKLVTKINYEVDYLRNLLEQIPEFKYFNQYWYYQYQNWLPFYWEGFKQTTRYTYVIEDTGNLEVVWNNFRNDVRTEVRKGEQFLKITYTISAADFFKLMEKSYEKQNQLPPFSLEFIEKAFKVLEENKAFKIICAEDKDGTPIAAMLLVYDETFVYYLLGGVDAEKINGAMGFVIWNAIKFASETGKKFDFLGSIMPKIERFFRKFAGEQKTYFSVYKRNNSRKDLIVNGLRLIKRGITMKEKHEVE
jgi:GNAT acetyltransferase-like protein